MKLVGNTSSNTSQSENMAPEEKILKGDRGVENMGLCVFKHDSSYLGDLTALETLSYSIIRNEVNNFTVTMDSPFDPSSKIDITLDSLSIPKISVNTEGNPIINISLNLRGKVLNELTKVDYSDSKTLINLNNSVKEYLYNQIMSYLNKTTDEFKCDLNGFNKFAKKNFYTNQDFTQYNWAKEYENAEFNLDINSNIISSLLIQNS